MSNQIAKQLMILFLFCLISFQPAPVSALDPGIEITVQRFLESCKTGNSQELLSLLTDPLLEERKLLLTNNPAYSEFLIKRYKDATLRILNQHQTNETKATVDVEIAYGVNKSIRKIQFVLVNEGGVWKISREVIE